MADCHFTYEPPTNADLQQGDLISKTPAIQELLEQVHPHYRKKDDYSDFVVLTQTCDLVRRKGVCKAKYISLAAVRPLSLVLEREIQKYQDKIDQKINVCSADKRQKLEEFLSRLYNNNEAEYFYVEPEPTYGLIEASCVFLRLSIAVRAHEHYAKVLDARRVSLNDVFQAKLVRAHRTSLLAHVLTIARAWFAAGRPQTKKTPWGSFESWAEMIPQMLVWLGLPSPMETREAIEADDPTDIALRTLLATWLPVEALGSTKGMTAREFVDKVFTSDGSPQRGREELAAALEQLAPGRGRERVDVKRLSYILRGAKHRVIGGRKLVSAGSAQGVSRWTVRESKG